MNPSSPIPCAGVYDIVVAGGGMAGVGAACAAARQGARVLLVERLETLGGLGAAGGVGNFCFGDDSLPHGHGKVFDDIWEALRFYGAIGEEYGWRAHRQPPFFNHTFDHNMLPIALQEIAERDGVELLFATDAIGVEREGPTVSSAVLHNRSLCRKVEAQIFVDCTGDGILARHAGAEELPPDPEHPQSIPPSHMIFLQKSARPRLQPSRPPAAGLPPPKYSVWPEPERIGLKMWWPDGDFDTSTGKGFSDAARAFRRRIPEFVRHFQSTPQGRDFVFASSAPMFGLRDSVRIVGNYVLTEEDLRAGRHFEDAVAHGCFPLDSAALSKDPMPPYQIPYRSLIVRGLENVLIAGRCFSATRVALSSARIMPTCCLMGQAAGVAAALACKKRIRLRAMPASAIRERLLADSGGDPVLRQRLEP